MNIQTSSAEAIESDFPRSSVVTREPQSLRKAPRRSALFVSIGIELIGVTGNFILALLFYIQQQSPSRPVVDDYDDDDGATGQQEEKDDDERPEFGYPLLDFHYPPDRLEIWLISSCCVMAVTIIVVALLVAGIRFNKRWLFLPHLVAQACGAVGLCVPILWYCLDAGQTNVALQTWPTNRLYKARLIHDIIVLEVVLVAAALNLFIFRIVWRSYRFVAAAKLLQSCAAKENREIEKLKSPDRRISNSAGSGF